jgi:predicted RNA-binding Zn ribbon-like protein
MAYETYPSYGEMPPKLIAGARCLDFLNTVEWRGVPEAAGERLTGYGEFLIWAAAAGLVSARERAALQRLAARDPAAAARALADIKHVRATIGAALEGGGAARRRALGALDAMLQGERFVLRIEGSGDDVAQRWEPQGPELRRPLLTLLREAVELLASDAGQQVQRCANERCGWVFLDTSRNRSRRWCQMATCGNVAKVRAHYRRAQRAPSR